MRCLFILLLLACMGCQSKTPAVPVVNDKTEPLPASRSEQIARTLFEHFNKHDWAAMAALYSDTAYFRDPALGIELVQQTHPEIIAKYQELEKQVPDVKDSITAVYACGKEHVTVEFTSSGTGPDGKHFQLPICALLKIENGKITQDRTYYDNF